MAIPEYHRTNSASELVRATARMRDLNAMQVDAIHYRANQIRHTFIQNHPLSSVPRVQYYDVVEAIDTLTEEGVLPSLPPASDLPRRTLLMEVRRDCDRQIELAEIARGKLLMLMRVRASGRPEEKNDLLMWIGVAHAQCLATISVNRDLARAIDAELR